MTPPAPGTVVVARFEDLVAAGLRALIADDSNMAIVAADVSADRLDVAIGTHAPAVAILNFGTLSSPAQVHELHTRHPGTRLIVLANRPSPIEANQLLAFGATACLAKETQARDILNAIQLASRGLHVLPRPAEELSAGAPELVTPREAEVLGLLQSGNSNGEIAMTLHVSVETVRTHARNIYRKRGVRTRRDLAASPTRVRS